MNSFKKNKKELYQLAMRKRREIEKVRKIDNPFYSTKKELDARDCFHKTGIYAEF